MKLRKSEIKLLKELLHETEKMELVLKQLEEKSREESMMKYLISQRKKNHERMDEIRTILIDGSIVPYRLTIFTERINQFEIDTKTLLDCSVGNIAAITILQKTKKLSNQWKALNHNENIRKFVMEIATEMVAMEENSIKELKEFL